MVLLLRQSDDANATNQQPTAITDQKTVLQLNAVACTMDHVHQTGPSVFSSFNLRICTVRYSLLALSLASVLAGCQPAAKPEAAAPAAAAETIVAPATVVAESESTKLKLGFNEVILPFM